MTNPNENPESKGTEGQIDYEKIDYTKIDPAKIPDTVAQASRAFGGLLAETQELREANRGLSESNTLLETELQSRQQEEGQEDEFVSRKEAREMAQDAVQTAEKKRQAEQAEATAKTEKKIHNQSLRQLRADFPADGENAVADGLDADTVLRVGAAWLIANKPKIYNACIESDDPARELYEQALSFVPALKKKAKAHENAKFLETIKEGRIPKGAGGAPPEDETSELLDLIDNKSEEEIMALIANEDED